MTTARGFAVAALVALLALPAGRAAHAMSLSCDNDHVRWADHHDPAAALVAIDSEDGKITLVLTRRAVAFQLSERTLRHVRRELREKRAEQDNWLASAIVAGVAEAVDELIDHSIECRLRDLRDVSYENGRLVFTDHRGDLVFEDTDLCDNDVASAFSEQDARKFVREFRRLKAGSY